MERSQSFNNLHRNRPLSTLNGKCSEREQWSASTSNIQNPYKGNSGNHLNASTRHSPTSPTLPTSPTIPSLPTSSFNNRLKKYPERPRETQTQGPTSGTNSSAAVHRRKRLQRQKSAEVYHSSSIDDIDYAADLDEADDELDGCKVGRISVKGRDGDQMTLLKRVLMTSPPSKKQVQFCYRQQSESSLSPTKPDFEEMDEINLHMSSMTKPIVHSPHQASLSSNTSALALSTSMNPGNVNDYKRSSSTSSSTNLIYDRQHSSSSNDNNRAGTFQRQRPDCLYSTDSSRYSSVDSLLEARKPDPEAILINLGFGPMYSEDILSRIPKRFLKPSQVRGIDTDAFIKRSQLANSIADHSVLGYRGLTGNPDIPPSHIVAKIMQRFQVNERKKSLSSMELKLR